MHQRFSFAIAALLISTSAFAAESSSRLRRPHCDCPCASLAQKVDEKGFVPLAGSSSGSL